ncbi:hypothetical protein [Vibrio coralliirubri]|uniref:hypothetical protein n=1 Tax=Vibrio coralliirubri TaxID=1516159 RepID=UPI00076AA736|nr:hypothetical protein [Vibrio coralliirubri]
MKASLLAISISSVLVAPAFATAPQVDVELANQQTLQLIDGQMKAVDASVQYKLNEQYANATPGTTATIDDVTYEKQSNGTWAAVGAASAALVAGLLSSSSSSSSSDNGNTTPELPVTTSMDSVGTWKVADNDSGYIVTLAGQEVYVDSSNVTLNNDGTATIVVNDRKLIVGINGDELYRVDQVSRPGIDIPDGDDMPQLSDPEYGNGIVGQGWVKVDVGAGDTNYHKFEKVTDEGVKTIEVADQRSSGNGVDIRIGDSEWRNFDGSKIEAAQDFIDEHFRPADMPQLSDPEYGNGIVGQGWVKVDVGAGNTNYHKFEKVTDEGVKTIEVADQRSSGNGVDIRIGDGEWRNFDGSKISNIKEFIDEHLKPVVVTLNPTVKNNVKDKVQSIEPAKLQKAKSTIQQRLRG